MEEIDVIKTEIKKELKEKKPRPEYLMPTNSFTKAELVLKLITVGNSVGFQISKDLCHGMKLKKGQLLKVYLELFPEDAVKIEQGQ